MSMKMKKERKRMSATEQLKELNPDVFKIEKKTNDQSLAIRSEKFPYERKMYESERVLEPGGCWKAMYFHLARKVYSHG